MQSPGRLSLIVAITSSLNTTSQGLAAVEPILFVSFITFKNKGSKL